MLRLKSRWHLTPLLVLVGAAPLEAQTDSVRVSVDVAFQQAMERAPETLLADLRARAANEQARQNRGYENPGLSVSAENVGRAREITGLPSPDGIEGQIYLSLPLPIGPTRSGVLTRARGLEASAAADLRAATADAAVIIMGSLTRLLQQQQLVRSARNELATLTLLAESLALQSAEGRASRGDAARAELARGMGATNLARREVLLSEASTEVAWRVGMDPDQVLRLEAPSCAPGAGVVPPDQVSATPSTEMVQGLPSLARAQAQVEIARGSVDRARGARLPDFIPQVGLRRGQGVSALYLGLSTTLPFFNQGSAGVASAQLELDAATAAARALTLQKAAELASARRGLAALEDAGRGFDASWFEALDVAVQAAEARYELGEGTLFELLDQRRARLQAMDDYAAWQAEWWTARTRVARLEGRTPDASGICTDPFREN